LVVWHAAYNPGQPLPPEFGTEFQNFAPAPISDLAFGPDRSLLYSTGADKALKEWKIASEAPTKAFGHPNLVDAVAFSPDAKVLATGCHDGKLRLFDLAKGTPIREINAHIGPMNVPAPIYTVSWSPDGTKLLTGSNDHSLKLWNPTTGAQLVECKPYDEKAFPKGHEDSVFCAAFSPDGTIIASGGSDRQIKLWNVANGQVIRELANPKLKPGPLPAPLLAHPGWVYGVRFTPDGKTLVSAGGAPMNRGFLGVWNVADGKLLSGDEMPLGTFFALALSPDGKYLALGTGGNPKATGQQPVKAYILKLPPTH
jgi:WD40 repeat protein